MAKLLYMSLIAVVSSITVTISTTHSYQLTGNQQCEYSVNSLSLPCQLDESTLYVGYSVPLYTGVLVETAVRQYW